MTLWDIGILVFCWVSYQRARLSWTKPPPTPQLAKGRVTRDWRPMV